MSEKDTKIDETEMTEEKIKDEAEKQEELTLSDDELKELCRERICPSCDVMKEAQADKLRALADSENVKKRLIRETDELKKYASESVLSDLLPILDNLDLALQHSQNLDACKDFVIGVEMTRKMFLDTVAKHGLEAVGNVGDEFDPNFHEAMGAAKDENLADNTIAALMQRGYVLKGRVIRPAKVMVNKLS